MRKTRIINFRVSAKTIRTDTTKKRSGRIPKPLSMGQRLNAKRRPSNDIFDKRNT
jgi:hypothetical protein